MEGRGGWGEGINKRGPSRERGIAKKKMLDVEQKTCVVVWVGARGGGVRTASGGTRIFLGLI